MQSNKKKKEKILFIIGLIILMIFVIGATYAYFKSQMGDNEIGDVEVITHTSDTLSFSIGEPINLLADMSNFYEGADELEPQSTTATVILTANSNTKEASKSYYVYLDIITNQLTHSVDSNTTEVLMTVVGPTGEIKSLNGLRYDQTLGGFDITETNNLIKITPDNHTIDVVKTSGNLTNSETWTVTVKLINLETDQIINAGKEFKAKLIIQENDYMIADRCNNLTLTECITNIMYTGVDGENNIYKHDGIGQYGTLEAGSNADVDNPTYENSYRYSGASNEVNNYVCFGGDCDNTGTSENLYRIIGVFNNQVKLIKASIAQSTLLGTSGAYYNNTNYFWDRGSDYNNTWSHSLLNTLNLNSGYTPGNNTTVEYGFLYSIDHGTDNKKWSDYIAEHTWIVGGNTYSNISSITGIRNVYNYEIVRSGLDGAYTPPTYGEYEYTNKIGLLDVSEYMYASEPNDSSKPWSDLMGWNADYTKDFQIMANKNWLIPSENSWLIYRQTDNNTFSAIITSSGCINSYTVNGSNSVRPVFYLNSDVEVVTGTGNITNPYILK